MNVTSSTSYASPATASSDLQASGRAAPGDGKDSLATTSTSGTASSSSSAKTTDSTLVKLKARDQEVRQHEQAHLSAAGGLATSSPSYTYQRGSDGQNYAIGGEVSIDVSPGRTPEETIRKAQIVERAALAPKDPSGPDRSIAVQARKMAQQAQAQLREQARVASQDDTAASKGGTPPSTTPAVDGNGTPNTSLASSSQLGTRVAAAYARPANEARAISAYA